MDLYIRNGKVYVDHAFRTANIVVENGKIAQITNEALDPKEVTVYDAKGNYVLPGCIDVHTHGAVNVDVNAASVDDLEKLSAFHASQGTTSWLCSILTDTREQTLWAIEQYNLFKARHGHHTNLIGIHLEGPFLAPAYKGSMPEHLLTAVNMDLLEEYQKAANGDVRYITIAPEVEGAVDNIARMKALGITVSLGHSGADYETSMQSIENGATSITHTFNAMQLLHQHYPAIAGAALESDAYCEAICDGRHLHPGIVRLLLKAKGLDKVVAITDSIMATGLPDGKYKLGVNDIVVEDGDARLADQNVRAGSTLTSNQSLKNLMKFTGRPLEEVIRLWTENPAKMLGIFEDKGSIEVNKLADFVILNEDYDVIDTFVTGKQLNK
ncbi:N-acetylglucosamine-6-phosphate deacetylase [Paraliobacillus sp. PM-2]|uniref:N-acetylglucosamine-6-phosphate deacetylase n=1 Tax=Paraliobacillus sp. PM-2 TaxID=1462524 RepID=UPI00061C25A9|nr:N-acetylglucosamine-6-phosphate deacetylase [Paraliobacillus sp. PM-2]CQR47413.1 N-acetylglucosamine-6-phosphate deacetylase [Paraliobacillus sp. PM-2]